MRQREQIKMATTADLSPSSSAHRSVQDRLGLFNVSGNRHPSSLWRVRRLSVHDRSNSDSSLAHPELQNRSSLTVSKHEVILGGEEEENSLIIYWDIKEEIAANDWIGLYLVGENNPSSYQSYKNRGVSGTSKGQIIWIIEPETFDRAVTKVCFKYYHGPSASIRAATPTVTIRNPTASVEQSIDSEDEESNESPLLLLAISGLKAEGLKKGMFFNPDPYVKMSMHPGKKRKVGRFLRHVHKEQHKRTSVAENTCMPVWDQQRFEFTVSPTDVLEIEVKDKFAKSRPIISRFLGRLSLPVQRLLEKVALGERTVSYTLCKRHPTDHINGTIMFTMDIQELPQNSNMIVNGVATPEERNRSSSVPAVGSPEAAIFRRPRSPSSEAVDILHSIATRTASAPAQSAIPLTVDVSGENASAYDDPITPTDAIMSNPILQEQLLSVTQDVQERSETLSGIQSILCKDVLNDVSSDTTSSLSASSSNSGRNSVSSTSSKKLSGSLTLDLPSSNALSDMGTQTSPSPSNIASGSDSQGSQARNHQDSPNTRRRRAGQFSQSVQNETIDSDSESGDRERAPAFIDIDEIVTSPDKSLENLRRTADGVSNIYGENRPLPDLVVQSDQVSLSGKSSGTNEDGSLQLEINEELSKLKVRSGSSERSLSGTSSTGEVEHKILLDQKTQQNDLDQPSSCHGGGVDAGASTSSTISPEEGDLTMQNNHHSGSTSHKEETGATGGEQSASVRKKTSVVWKRRQGVRSADPDLSIIIPDATTSSTNAGSTPSTPVMTPNRATYMRYELPPSEEPLPTNWEARIDQYGRIFYIDHTTHITTWKKPSLNQQGGAGHDSQEPEMSRRQLNRRYQSFSRTLSREDNRQVGVQDSSLAGVPEAIPPVESPVRERSILESPAVKFIIRPDFFTLLHSNAEAKSTFQRNNSVKHMVNRVRRDPNKFKDYQHNRDLVALLNLFADTTAELPRGWESKRDKSGKSFFINHNSRTTTFIDPRLPIDILDPTLLLQIPKGRARSHSEGEDDVSTDPQLLGSQGERLGPPVQPRPAETLSNRSSLQEEVPLAYNEKVVAFLKQANIMDILQEREPALENNQPLREKISIVRSEGVEALERLSNDFELTLILSLFDDSIASFTPAQQQPLRSTLANISPYESPNHSPHSSPVVSRANHRAPAPYRRNFDTKLRHFYRKLEAKGYGQGPTKLKLTIRRDHLLEDAFGKIMAINRRDVQKCKLFICFAGEEGLDYGGPSREFFFLLSRELFNPYYGLFEYSAIDTYTVQISPMSAFVDNYLEWFRFCGRVVGLAIIHHFLLDAFFTRPFYKALLRQPCTLVDLEQLDAEFHQSLQWMKDNDITDVLDLMFTADEEVFGQIIERELKPNGKNIPVTEKNKKEYIQKMVKFRIERGVSDQAEALVKGFYEVVDTRLISVFDARELELVIAGTAEIDVVDWRKNTEYRGGYHNSHHVILWFWTAVERFDNERRLRLLQFVTGTSSIPYEGFAALRGSNGPKKFCIEKWGQINSLPRAHTCFNRLDLPPYTSFVMLLEKLVIAVEESSTFGID